MPMLIFFPLLPFIFEVGLVIYWVAVTAMLYSAGDLVANCRVKKTTSFAFSDFANISNQVPSYNPFNATNNPSVAVCYKNSTV